MTMRPLRFFILILLLSSSAQNALGRSTTPPEVTYEGRPEIEAFALHTAAQYGLDAATIVQVLSQARRLDAVQRAVMPLPGGAKKNWQVYRSRFIDRERIRAGVSFWNVHADALRRAADEYGVPERIIVGILGVETIYGRNMGQFRVIDALATLSFDFPPGRSDRSAYFQRQLAQFFALCARDGIDPASVRGSYAGAIGMGQFMPESILNHAVDYDGDGQVHLGVSAADAIGSVARYFSHHGWVSGLPAVLRVDVSRANLQRLLEPDIIPTFDADDLQRAGATPQDALPARERFAVVELQNGDAPSDYVLGTRNFFVITRYNRSAYYAMSVVELARAVQAARDASPGAKP
ncbi:MAG: lytic murein transglycosylase B [Betaproteobacteria bacterium]|nr:lytic murein transglycosylase B [Betaproteobacteria bacterium]